LRTPEHDHVPQQSTLGTEPEQIGPLSASAIPRHMAGDQVEEVTGQIEEGLHPVGQVHQPRPRVVDEDGLRVVLLGN